MAGALGYVAFHVAPHSPAFPGVSRHPRRIHATWMRQGWGTPLLDIVTWFQSQPTALQPAILSAATAVGLFVLGFLTIAGTAWANRRNTLKAARDQQKLDIYNAILKDINAASDAQLDATTFAGTAAMMLRIQADMVAGGVPWGMPRERLHQFEQLHRAQTQTFSVLHGFLEQWAILDPRLEAFRKAFGYQAIATLEAATALSGALRFALPVDNPDGGVFPYSPPSREQAEAVGEVAARYQRESSLLGAYIGDLNVELQPLLLGHLFGRRIVRRAPPDPTQFAIRLDRHRQIVRHFKNTPFFKKGSLEEAELRRRHGTVRFRWWQPWTRQ